MNAGEFGTFFYQNVGYDISAFTGLQLQVDRPDGTSFVKINPDVSVGNAPVATVHGVFEANKYCKYKWQPGDITVPGIYVARLTYTAGTDKKLISDFGDFIVRA